jgi:hypothetical protein
VVVVTRPASDFRDKHRTALEEGPGFVEKSRCSIGVQIQYPQEIFCIGPKNHLVWYLSFGGAEESIMRLESPNIVHELMKSLSLSSESLNH